mmetsp:Transcript_13927/g.33676  ORF Transcript_13927/g.33676 Transcript_13927/m.33676 type:complete len:266 (+) Transcript_13927:1059-1856(+)
MVVVHGPAAKRDRRRLGSLVLHHHLRRRPRDSAPPGYSSRQLHSTVGPILPRILTHEPEIRQRHGLGRRINPDIVAGRPAGTGDHVDQRELDGHRACIVLCPGLHENGHLAGLPGLLVGVTGSAQLFVALPQLVLQLLQLLICCCQVPVQLRRLRLVIIQSLLDSLRRRSRNIWGRRGRHEIRQEALNEGLALVQDCNLPLLGGHGLLQSLDLGVLGGSDRGGFPGNTPNVEGNLQDHSRSHNSDDPHGVPLRTLRQTSHDHLHL